MKLATQFALHTSAGASRKILAGLLGSQRSALVGALTSALVAASTFCTIQTDYAIAQEVPVPQKVRRVKRVKRPVFEGSETKDLFFRDLSDALVGERPDPVLTAAANKTNSLAGGADSSSGADGDSWKSLIDSSVIEDEVKTEQQKIAQLVTTPVIFQTKFGEINQSFEVLSTLFAVIRQYDGEVRWAKQAAAAQMMFEQAAVASRTGTVTGFRMCQTRKEELQELVRGGSIVASEPVPDSIDWSKAAHRSPLMVRLETANESLKQMTANEKEFQSSTEEIYHESNIVAMLAKVILEEGMPDADDDGYIDFGKQMQTAAVELKSAVKTNNFSDAAAAANSVGQSCSDCHAEWR